jgi:uncharacterized protein (UPF0335 family)
MPKAAKIESDEVPAISNSGIKELTKRYFALVAEKKEAGDAIKDLMAEVKAKGLKPKSFKAAAKELEEVTDAEYKDEVNLILEANGQQRLFL